MIVTAQSAPEVSQSGHVETGWAKRLTYCAPQWVSWLGLGGQTDYCPIRPIVAIQNPTSQIVLVPARVVTHQTIGDKVFCALDLDIENFFDASEFDAFNLRRCEVGSIRQWRVRLPLFWHIPRQGYSRCTKAP